VGSEMCIRDRENIGEACRISGLSQSRLYALLKKHEIPT
jgi:two-component system NtrC family response regulator